MVSTKVDIATDRVVDLLNQRGVPVVRLNTEDLPYSASISTDLSGSPELADGRSVRIHRPRAVWYRRIRSPPCPSDVSEPVNRYVANESYWALRGTLCNLSGVGRWMSHPTAVEHAEQKLVQLRVASTCGFAVPRTLVTSSPLRVREFWSESKGHVVAKPLRSGYLPDGRSGLAMYTTRLNQAHVDSLDECIPTPLIIQQEVPKSLDIRVTIVGASVFSAAIHSHDDPAAIVDWRRTTDPDLPHSRHVLPQQVRSACMNLMNQLGLSFGAIDLVLDPNGDYYFLEVNPSGQWLWIEDQLDLPISATIASYLTGDPESDATA